MENRRVIIVRIHSVEKSCQLSCHRSNIILMIIITNALLISFHSCVNIDRCMSGNSSSRSRSVGFVIVTYSFLVFDLRCRSQLNCRSIRTCVRAYVRACRHVGGAYDVYAFLFLPFLRYFVCQWVTINCW